jgi:hypothetical protein
MSTCQHRLGDRTGLLCVLPAGHDFGHVYYSGHGSEVDDRHESDRGHG